MILTRRGAGVAAAGALLTAGGAGLRYPELAALGAAALLAVLLSALASLRPPGLEVTRAVAPRQVMRGEACRVTLEARHPGRLPFTLNGEDRCSGPVDRRIPIPALRLRPGETAVVRYPVQTDRRGIIRLGPLSAGRADPLGLVGTRRSIGPVASLIVYPRLHPVAARPPGVRRDAEGGGGRLPHGSVSVDALRAYVPGDDPRQVHWRSSARLGRLVVRERADAGRARLTVLLDDRAEVHDDDTFEAACEAAASTVAAAVRVGTAVHLMLAGGEVVPSGRALGAYLGLLARACRHPAAGPSAAETGGRPLPPLAGEMLLCLTGRPDATQLRGLVRPGRHTATVLAVFGPQDSLPAGTGFRLIVARDGADFARQWDGLA
ncbi:DUF58 domain-containing protein [Dactylosporangium sp. CA-092794]|uniref:DUF58 domain-containing protein n=1 Tax=Dactylosporangium sp. CA-092794 TaxID=3239929 RepID=UPI003D91C744